MVSSALFLVSQKESMGRHSGKNTLGRVRVRELVHKTVKQPVADLELANRGGTRNFFAN